ncbi:MAG: UDP-N-acetylenolpyruvoylglucosamine reductase [Candidatus Doudnabacteria bacterium]|nr:UDP-N-acetylenolpyruvoylglucosamine reductase [Candidatus Doudnabacteria bacterium]
MQNNVQLAKFTSFRIGGPAKYFVEAKTDNDIVEALSFANENKLKFFVLGSGTNILVQDQGFDGVVIRNQLKDLKLEDGLVVADSGLLLVLINQFANKNGRVGFEKLSTVPGTLGGALYNNAHWQDDLLSYYVQWVEVIDPADPGLKIQRLTKEQLDFGYDSSLIKKKNLVALRAALLLPEGDVEQSRKTMLSYMKSRSDSQPYGTANSGCMFQNIPQTLGPGNHGTSAGYLIDQAGLNGMRVGDAVISEKHGNFFINEGHAKSGDILKLAEIAREKVKAKFGVNLEFEVKVI